MIIPLLAFIVGLILNGFSAVTFASLKNISSGCGIYLLVSCISSQLVLTLLFARIVYQTISRHIVLDNTLNLTLCRLLPYFMSACWYTGLWLQTCVTLERALTVVRPTTWLFMKNPRAATLVSCVLLISVFSSIVVQINAYTTVQHPSEDTVWCVVDPRQTLIRFPSLVHQLTPFLVNTFATIILITAIARATATALGGSKLRMFFNAVKKHLEIIVAPCICFLTQSPQIAILFLDSCSYANTDCFVANTDCFVDIPDHTFHIILSPGSPFLYLRYTITGF